MHVQHGCSIVSSCAVARRLASVTERLAAVGLVAAVDLLAELRVGIHLLVVLGPQLRNLGAELGDLDTVRVDEAFVADRDHLGDFGLIVLGPRQHLWLLRRCNRRR